MSKGLFGGGSSNNPIEAVLDLTKFSGIIGITCPTCKSECTSNAPNSEYAVCHKCALYWNPTKTFEGLLEDKAYMAAYLKKDRHNTWLRSAERRTWAAQFLAASIDIDDSYSDVQKGYLAKDAVAWADTLNKALDVQNPE